MPRWTPTRQRVLTNVLFTLGAEFLGKVSIFVGNLIIARALGPVEFGKFTFAFAIASILVIIVDFGFNSFLAREVAIDQNRISHYYHSVIVTKIVLAIIYMAVTIALVSVTKHDSMITLIAVNASLYNIGLSFILLVRYIFKSQFKAFAELLLFSLYAPLFIGLLVFLLYFVKNPNAPIMSLPFAVTALLSAVFGIWLVYHLRGSDRPPLQKSTVATIRLLLKRSLPFAINLFFISVYLRVSLTLLSFLTDDYTTGIYGAAFNLYINLILAFSLVFQVLFPVIAKQYARSKIEAITTIKKITLVIFIAAPLISILLYFASPMIIRLLYDHSFSDAIPLLKVFAIGLPLGILTTHTNTIFRATNLEGKLIISSAAGTFIIILLCLMLIPRYGALGAVYAAILNEAAMGLINAYFIFHKKVLREPS